MKASRLNRNLFFVFLISAVVFSVCACVSVRKNAGVSVVHTMPDTEFYSADIEQPVFEGQEGLNNLIAEKIGDWFAEFESEIQLNSAAYSDVANRPKGAFYVDWRLDQNSRECVSVLLTAYSYTGGANGQDQLASFTWDKKSQSLISLEQVLPSIVSPPSLQSLAEFCRSQLRETIGVDDDGFLEEMLELGTDPVPENYQVFTLSNLGATVYFTKYQVAPGSYGIQEVFLPYID